MFSGTLRMNLDPCDLYKDKDEEIWRALEHAQLKTHVESLAGQLDYPCSEGGKNFRLD